MNKHCATIPLLGRAIEIADRRGMKAPEGLEWGLRAVHTDFTSSRGYRWAFPGKWSKASGPFTKNNNSCPSAKGDGICAGLSWSGIASGQIPAITVLLIGWKPEDVLAHDSEKIRVKKAFVRDALIIREILTGCDGANLYGADLYGANLYGADLYGADLRRANLYGADLRRANLYGANLSGADLSGADLRRANLYGANLSGADLSGADLYGADLSGADLRSALLPINFIIPAGARS